MLKYQVDCCEVSFPRPEPKLEIPVQMIFFFLRAYSQKKLRKWQKPNRIVEEAESGWAFSRALGSSWSHMKL